MSDTSRSEEWSKFHPAYPHGGVPYPGASKFEIWTDSSLAVWEGLKELQDGGISRPLLFRGDSSSELERNKSKCNAALGSALVKPRKGVVNGWRTSPSPGATLIDEVTARHALFLPLYRWLLDTRLQAEILRLRHFLSQGYRILLVDPARCTDFDNVNKPISHIALVRAYLSHSYPFVPSSAPSSLSWVFDPLSELSTASSIPLPSSS